MDDSRRVEERLEALDVQIAYQYERLETYYKLELGEEDLDKVFRQLDLLLYERELQRLAYAALLRRDAYFTSVDWREVADAVTAAFTEIAERFRELAEAICESFTRLLDSSGLTGDVIKRLMREGEASSRPGPRQIFSPAVRGVGRLGERQYAYALPPSRKPWLRGFQRAKGKG